MAPNQPAVSVSKPWKKVADTGPLPLKTMPVANKHAFIRLKESGFFATSRGRKNLLDAPII
jgi:hypothetical protein